MKTKKVGNKVLLRLDKGDEVVESIKKACEENGVDYAFVSGIGGTIRAVFAYYDMGSHKYVNTEVVGHRELISLNGNVSRKDGKFVSHLHVALGGPGYEVVGGHLVSAEISVTAEICIEMMEDGFKRSFNEEFGANLWDE